MNPFPGPGKHSPDPKVAATLLFATTAHRPRRERGWLIEFGVCISIDSAFSCPLPGLDIENVEGLIAGAVEGDATFEGPWDREKEDLQSALTTSSIHGVLDPPDLPPVRCLHKLSWGGGDIVCDFGLVIACRISRVEPG